jgi:hypothetical protein
MTQSYQLISAQTLTANTASVTFSNIPQNYTDLLLKISVRTTNTQYGETVRIKPNNSASNGFARVMRGFSGTSTSAYTYSNVLAMNNSLGDGATASTFASIDVYIPNYTSSNYKSFSGDAVSETNASDGRVELNASLWSDSAAITSLVLDNDAGSPFSFTANSTFTLYGIGGSRATGGTITADGNYTYHTFTSTGTFTALERIRGAEALVVAGGGGGAISGGGAGGVFYTYGQTLAAGNSYAVVVGSGGAAGTSGSNSTIASFVATGGGTGGYNGNGGTGGSGGGAGTGTATTYTGGSSTQSSTGGVGYGFAGGNATASSSGNEGGAGGGGGGSVGYTMPGAGQGGDGGAGLSVFDSWHYATSTGVLSNATRFIAGGGAGSGKSKQGTGGTGGGGNASNPATNGTANTGGGGGGNVDSTSGSGGSGLVIIRYPNS